MEEGRLRWGNRPVGLIALVIKGLLVFQEIKGLLMDLVVDFFCSGRPSFYAEFGDVSFGVVGEAEAQEVCIRS